MPRITTRPATLTAVQAASMLDGGKGVREVVIDGTIVVGQYAKNKYGVTIGHFDVQAMVGDENPFVAARISHTVMPTMRGGRKVKDVVADIAAAQVGRYERYLRAQGVAHKLRDAGVSHTAIYFGGPSSTTQPDEWVGYITDLATTYLR